MKILFIILYLIPSLIFGQSSFGVSVGLQNSAYITEYSKVLDFQSCCPMYFSPVSNSFLLGISHSFIINDDINLFTALQYSQVNPSTSSKYSYPILKDNTVQNVDFEYTSQFSFHQFELSSGIERILNNHFSLGSRLGIVSELSTNYSQSERILTEGVQYTNPNFEQIVNQDVENTTIKGIMAGFLIYKTPINTDVNFVSRLEFATIFDRGNLPINVSSFFTKLLIGIDIPLDKNTKTSPLNPEK